MRKAILAVLFLVATCLGAWAQKLVVTGKVTDSKGAAISGASVREKGTKNGVSADNAGNFSLSVAPGATLQISGAGFMLKEVKASETVSVSLEDDVSNLSEVVVTALGVQRQAKDLGYATAKIKSSELTQGKAVNLQNGLTGKVSGLNITTVNSGVFGSTKINLRGVRSLTGNNQPMLVVDAIPTPLAYISSLNPNDVQDVTILKGASAAAIYGPDGVNGVIIVTTKKGTKGNPTITISNTTQVESVSYLPKLQTRFGSGSGEDAYGRPVYTPYENQQFGPEFDGQIVDLGKPLEDGSIQKVPYSPIKDERKKFWDKGITNQLDISLSSQNFYLAAQDVNIKGVMPGDENRRTGFRFNAGKDFGKFKAAFNINYIQQNYDVVNEAASLRYANTYSGSIYFSVMNTPAHVPLTSYKDWQNNPFASYGGYYNEYARNPYWLIDNHREIGRTHDLLASVDLNYKFAPWLSATYRLGTNQSFSSSKVEINPIISTDYAISTRGASFANAPGSVWDNSANDGRINQDFYLSGNTDIGDFKISYLVGSLVRENYSKNMQLRGNNLVVPYLFNVANRTGEPVATESNFKNRLASLYGSLSVSFRDWAFVELVGRNDWDSRLSLNDQSDISYFYPGVSASLVLTDMMPSIKGDILSFAKVRGSLSKSGNVNLGTYALEAVYNQTNGFPYGNLGGFSAGNVKPDVGIQPEFVNTKEVGVELGFFRNRVNIEATYFHQNNTNQILQVSQSAATGYPLRLANTADFINKGIEVDLRLTPVIKAGDFNFDFRANFTYNDNEVTSLFPGINELEVGGTTGFTQRAANSPSAFNYAIVGMPAYVFKISDYERDTEGRVIVDAVTGNPKVSENLITTGRSLPKYLIGLNPSISWKGISASATFDYRGGHNVFHGLGSDMDFTGMSERSAQFGRQRFVFPNSVYLENGKYVPNENILTSSGGIDFWANGSVNTQVGTNYYSSAASWKMRELAISYEVPLKVLGNGKVIKKLVISAVGRNLFTWLPESNDWTDPEFNYTATGNTFGINSSFSTPPTRVFGGSVLVTF
jgi:TonB-linked SusC/RagA family outer membrane protein